MKVIKRSQVTKVVVDRMVSHELRHNDIRFVRREFGKVEVPHMDCNFLMNNIKVQWGMYINDNTLRDLTSKEVKELKLNELFDEIDINSRNGNGK